MSSRHTITFALALFAIAGMAALPSAAASTADDVGSTVDEILEDPRDLICYFTPYPEDDYPVCVRKIFGP